MVAKSLRTLGSVWKRLHTNWKNVVFVQIFSRFLREMTFQYSNIYIRELGATPLELGTVNSASGFGRTIISLPLGYLQDKYSVKKIYLTMLSLSTLIPLCYAIATSWELVVPAILIAGLGVQYACPLICNLLLPNEDRATGKAVCESSGALLALIAPSIAAILVTWFGGLNQDGIRPLYWIQFAALVILTIFMLSRLNEIVRPKRKSQGTKLLGDFHEVFQRGVAVKRWVVVNTLNMFNMAMVFPYRYPYANEVKGAGPFIIGGIATTMFLAEALFPLPFGRLADQMGRKRLFYFLAPLFSMANILFVLAPYTEWLFVAGFLMGFRSVGTLAFRAMTPELVPSELLGRWQGLLGLFTGLASIIAPIFGGVLWEYLGPEWVFIVMTIIDLFVLLPVFSTVPETLHEKQVG